MPDCLHCQETFTGRSDKKFCHDHCRSAYHYHRSNKTNTIIRKINSQLKRNRQLLHNIFSNNNQIIKKSSLFNLGFDFNHITHTQRCSHHEYKFCYDVGYIELNEVEVKIVIAANLISHPRVSVI